MHAMKTEVTKDGDAVPLGMIRNAKTATGDLLLHRPGHAGNVIFDEE